MYIIFGWKYGENEGAIILEESGRVLLLISKINNQRHCYCKEPILLGNRNDFS